MEYAFTKKVEYPFDEALARTKEALKAEGFGILTEVDVKETMKKKLDAQYENYIILGACNPPLAHASLQVKKNIGLFLPCNVIVYEEDGTVFVEAIRPSAAMSIVENDELAKIAAQAEDKLKTVIDAV